MTGDGVGASPARVGGIDRVTGRQAYVADIRLERRPPRQARDARLRPGADRLDRHERRPRRPRRAPRHDRRRPARSRCRASVRSSGTARSSRSARRTTTASRSPRSPPRPSTPPRRRPRLVRVEYEELPAVVHDRRRPRPGAPLVQDPSLRPGDPLAATNVLREHHYGWGDVDAAAGATSSSRAPTRFPMVTQFAIEPHAFIAAPDGDGIAIWSSIQHPNWLQRVDRRRSSALPLAKVRVLRARPGRRVRRQAARQVRAARRVHGPPGRSTGPPRPDARGDVPGRAPRRLGDPRPLRLPRRRHARLPRRRGELPDRRLRRHRRPDGRARAATPPCGPYRIPAVRIVARSVLSHTTPVDGVPRLRQPAADLGGRVEHGRGRPVARHRSARAPAPEPRPARRRVHPRRHAGRRRLGADGPAGGRADRVGESAAARSRSRHRASG